MKNENEESFLPLYIDYAIFEVENEGIRLWSLVNNDSYTGKKDTNSVFA